MSWQVHKVFLPCLSCADVLIKHGKPIKSRGSTTECLKRKAELTKARQSWVKYLEQSQGIKISNLYPRQSATMTAYIWVFFPVRLCWSSIFKLGKVHYIINIHYIQLFWSRDVLREVFRDTIRHAVSQLIFST